MAGTRLTPKEKVKINKLRIAGHTQKVIAGKVGRSLASVERHINKQK